MIERGTISEGDLDLIKFTDSVDEAINHLHDRAVKQFGLRRKAPKSSVLLGEKSLPGRAQAR
jgi:predicted Rossmann-fold nucleotide-binding protein